MTQLQLALEFRPNLSTQRYAQVIDRIVTDARSRGLTLTPKQRDAIAEYIFYNQNTGANVTVWHSTNMILGTLRLCKCVHCRAAKERLAGKHFGMWNRFHVS